MRRSSLAVQFGLGLVLFFAPFFAGAFALMTPGDVRDPEGFRRSMELHDRVEGVAMALAAVGMLWMIVVSVRWIRARARAVAAYVGAPSPCPYCGRTRLDPVCAHCGARAS